MPPNNNFDLLTDDEVAKRLTRDATDWSLRYSSVGLESKRTQGPSRPANLARPNTQFLSNQIRQNMSHNTTRKKARTAAREDEDDLWEPRRSPRVKEAAKKAEEKRSEEEESKRKQAKERLAKQREQRSKKHDHVHRVHEGRVHKGQAHDERLNNGRTTTWSQKIIAARDERNNGPASMTGRKPVKDSPWSIKHQLRGEDRRKEDRAEDVIYCAYKSFNTGYYWIVLDDDTENDRTDFLSSKSHIPGGSEPDLVGDSTQMAREKLFDRSPPPPPEAHISPPKTPTPLTCSHERLDEPPPLEAHQDSLDQLVSRAQPPLHKPRMLPSRKPYLTVKCVRPREPTKMQHDSPTQQTSSAQFVSPDQRVSPSLQPSRRTRSTGSDRCMVKLIVSPQKLKRVLHRCIVKLVVPLEKLKPVLNGTGDSGVEASLVPQGIKDTIATSSASPAVPASMLENTLEPLPALKSVQAPELSHVSSPIPLSPTDTHDAVGHDPLSLDTHEAPVDRYASPSPSPDPSVPESSSLSIIQPAPPVASPSCSPDDRAMSPSIEVAENHNESHLSESPRISSKSDRNAKNVAIRKSILTETPEDFAVLLALATRAVRVSSSAHPTDVLIHKRKIPDEFLMPLPPKQQRLDPVVQIRPELVGHAPGLRTMEPPVKLSSWLRRPNRSVCQTYVNPSQLNQLPPLNRSVVEPDMSPPRLNRSLPPNISVAPQLTSPPLDRSPTLNSSVEPGLNSAQFDQLAPCNTSIAPSQGSLWSDQRRFAPREPHKPLPSPPQPAVAWAAATQLAPAPLLKAPDCGLRLVCPVLSYEPRSCELADKRWGFSVPSALGRLASALDS